jgi:hypothetical protein
MSSVPLCFFDGLTLQRGKIDERRPRAADLEERWLSDMRFEVKEPSTCLPSSHPKQGQQKQLIQLPQVPQPAVEWTRKEAQRHAGRKQVLLDVHD